MRIVCLMPFGSFGSPSLNFNCGAKFGPQSHLKKNTVRKLGLWRWPWWQKVSGTLFYGGVGHNSIVKAEFCFAQGFNLFAMHEKYNISSPNLEHSFFEYRKNFLRIGQVNTLIILSSVQFKNWSTPSVLWHSGTPYNKGKAHLRKRCFHGDRPKTGMNSPRN